MEFHSLNVKKNISNVLITEKSNFEEKKWATGHSCIRKQITSYKIGSLAEPEVKSWSNNCRILFQNDMMLHLVTKFGTKTNTL